MNRAPIDPGGRFVLYWMIANHRVMWNFAFQRAVEWSRQLDKALVVLQVLPQAPQWDCDRFHAFALQSMNCVGDQLRIRGVRHYPFVETQPGQAEDLLAALADHASLIVTDRFPVFIYPEMVRSAAARVPAFIEEVDSCGLLPLDAADKAYPTAASFRRFLQKQLPIHLCEFPDMDPLAGIELKQGRVPTEISETWPEASPALLRAEPEALSELPIDHSVKPVESFPGGLKAAKAALEDFLANRLPRYLDERSHPQSDASSNLSPYLHWGNLSAHQVFAELMAEEGWNLESLLPKATGSKSGWWGVEPAAEAFLDELITWRELGFNMCTHDPHGYDRYESLPNWARETLEAHEKDPRENTYTLAQFENAQTHDSLWNAAQTQLVREGHIHNYLRMVWGKKILEWTPNPRKALEVMIHLNNKYALDGRDPNSYSGIFWILGRYDRPWGPEREIFGKIRYMSSENTARKFAVEEYVERYAPADREP